MTDKAIGVGDLVCVVLPSPCVCSVPDHSLGKIKRVVEIVFAETDCDGCGKPWPADYHVVTPSGGCYDLFRCRRIPPLGELETEHTEAKEPSHA